MDKEHELAVLSRRIVDAKVELSSILEEQERVRGEIASKLQELDKREALLNEKEATINRRTNDSILYKL